MLKWVLDEDSLFYCLYRIHHSKCVTLRRKKKINILCLKNSWKKPVAYAYKEEIPIWIKIYLLDIRRHSICILLWKPVLVSPTPPCFPLIHSNLTLLKFPWPFLTALSWLFHIMPLYKVDEQLSLYLWQLFCYSRPCGLEQHLSLCKRLLTGLFKNRKKKKKLQHNLYDVPKWVF